MKKNSASLLLRFSFFLILAWNSCNFMSFEAKNLCESSAFWSAGHWLLRFFDIWKFWASMLLNDDGNEGGMFLLLFPGFSVSFFEWVFILELLIGHIDFELRTFECFCWFLYLFLTISTEIINSDLVLEYLKISVLIRFNSG